jgi:tetratricopeptide (TPR) repeat protein
VLLAVVFGGTFVLFGVGSQVPGGIADVLGRSGSATGQVDIGDARERIEENPQDPQANRDLATGLQQRGRAEEAIEPLETFTRLRPNDEPALRELAGLYLARAARYQREAQLAQYEASLASPGADFGPPPTSQLGQALGQPPISEAVQATYNERLTEAYGNMTDAYTDAKNTYAKVARLAPEDPDVQLQLASAAQTAGDTDTAIAAYERFLKIAPDHPSAPLVTEELKELRNPAPTAPTG